MTLEEKRVELEKTYKRLMDAHSAKYSKHIAKENEYRESARMLRMVYGELFAVAKELGDPVPIWM